MGITAGRQADREYKARKRTTAPVATPSRTLATPSWADGDDEFFLPEGVAFPAYGLTRAPLPAGESAEVL